MISKASQGRASKQNYPRKWSSKGPKYKHPAPSWEKVKLIQYMRLRHPYPVAFHSRRTFSSIRVDENNKLQQHIIFKSRQIDYFQNRLTAFKNQTILKQQRANHSSKEILNSRQSGCFQFQTISKQTEGKLHQHRISQFKTEWVLSTASNIKTNIGQITATQDFSIQKTE